MPDDIPSAFPEAPAANSIGTFFHCGNCLESCPEGQAPQEWTRLEAGWTTWGVQIRCVRCALNVIHIDFCGHKVDITVRGSDDA